MKYMYCMLMTSFNHILRLSTYIKGIPRQLAEEFNLNNSMQITDSHIDFSNHIKSKGMMILDDNPKIATSQLIYRLILIF